MSTAMKGGNERCQAKLQTNDRGLNPSHDDEDRREGTVRKVGEIEGNLLSYMVYHYRKLVWMVDGRATEMKQVFRRRAEWQHDLTL